MSWRLAESLKVLRAEIDSRFPARNRAYDGTIGDEAHQGRVSDHNPDENGVVRAFDATHDPEHGADMGILSVRVASSGHPALKYVIHDRLIWTPGDGWQRYNGDNPHRTHMHVSVRGDYDDPRPWGISACPVQTVAYRLTTPYMRGDKVKLIQVALQSRGHYLSKPDGVFGPLTDRAVREFQKAKGLEDDGIVGPQTMRALGLI